MVIRRFLALPANRRRLYLEAWRRLWIARVRLWLMPRSRVRDVLVSVPNVSPVSDAFDPRQVAHSVDVVSAYVPRGTCLSKAIAVRQMLAARGRPSEIRLGVARMGHRLDAHAWIEVHSVGELGRAGEELEFVSLGTLIAVESG